MYRIEPDPSVAAQIDALPDEVLLEYAQVVGWLQVAPWAGVPINERNPDAEVRQVLFGPDGAGMVTYLILDRDREVHILEVLWVG